LPSVAYEYELEYGGLHEKSMVTSIQKYGAHIYQESILCRANVQPLIIKLAIEKMSLAWRERKEAAACEMLPEPNKCQTSRRQHK
jgi:hypothetical protein